MVQRTSEIEDTNVGRGQCLLGYCLTLRLAVDPLLLKAFPKKVINCQAKSETVDHLLSKAFRKKMINCQAKSETVLEQALSSSNVCVLSSLTKEETPCSCRSHEIEERPSKEVGQLPNEE